MCRRNGVRKLIMTRIGSPISCVIKTSLAPQTSSRGTERRRAFDPLALAGTVHYLPQIAAPLDVEPEVGAVADHARKDERRRRRHVSAVVAQLVDVLALN